MNRLPSAPLFTQVREAFVALHKAEAIALKGLDIMDTQTLLIIIVLVLLLGGGGWYGRGRWF
jgi:hypothetical protein